MTANEFLRKLEDALYGQVSGSVLESNLRYYRGYIEEERAKGRSEEEILDGLGDPRLIARTIVETQSGSGNEYRQREPKSENREVYREEHHGFSTEGWKVWLVLLLILVVVVFVVSAVFGMLFRILLSPVFWILIAALVLIRIMTSRRR